MKDDLSRLILGALMPGISSERPEPWITSALAGGVEAVCLFRDAVGMPGRTRASTSALRAMSSNVIIALDEEAGEVTRTHAAVGSPFLSPAALGKIDDIDVTRASARLVGEMLGELGIDLVLGPVADVNVNPRNPVIGVRAFGGDADRVADHVAAFVDGIQSVGVGACVKHFPGHGDTHVDSHESLPVLDVDRGVLERRELTPFRAAIEAGTAAVMTGHLLVPALDQREPASLSWNITTGVLREEMRFTGVVISDAIEMGAVAGADGTRLGDAAVACLRAGADLVCIGADNQEQALAVCAAAIDSAIRSGELASSRLVEAAERRRRLGRQWHQTVHRVIDASNADVALIAAAAPRALDIVGDATLREREVAVMRLTANPGYAAGPTEWGVTEDLVSAGYDVEAISHDPAEAAGRELVIESRDIWKDERLADLLAIALAARPDAIVVDVGWPQPGGQLGRGLIRTRGTGRLLSALAACVLTGTDPLARASDVLASAHLETP